MPAGFAVLVMAFVPSAAEAHGFGMRYDLPLPLDYFIWGGAAVVLLSFVVAAVFLRPTGKAALYATRDLSGTWFGRIAACPALQTAIRIVGVFVFALTLLAGYVGAPNPYRNISIVMVWVIAWVGIAYVSALLGNIWSVLNPWSTLFRWAEWLGLKTLDLPYPAWLGAWPGFVQLFVFAWLEINWPGSGVPFKIAVALTIFTAITWTGMYLVGRETWARNGGMFVMVFALFARFGIFEMREGKLHLRPPAVGLLSSRPATFSEIAFVILILATVTYDGFTETELFQTLALALLEPLQGLGSIAVPVVSTIGLATVPALFILAYLIVAALVRTMGSPTVAFERVGGSFVYSLIPIAIAYHLAHYLSLLMFEGQNVFALISDPFGMGWNLFGTADFRADLTIMNAEFLWFFSVSAIVLGHVAAVYLAHVEAMRLFGTRGAALRSQIPMLALMIAYTMISLWIVAQPIVG
jgi:hypothetical protein